MKRPTQKASKVALAFEKIASELTKDWTAVVVILRKGNK